MRSHQALEVPQSIDPYSAWLEVNRWSERRELLLRSRLHEQRNLPVISVIVPVYNPPVEILRLAIESVAGQVYPRWELCIADDASPDTSVRALLGDWANNEARIRLILRVENGGISAASNSAAELATGEFLLFLDNDDALTPDALGEIALYLSEHPQTDVLYADEDKIDAKGRRYEPSFKPDWSPELLLSYNYIIHPVIIRRELFRKIGGFVSSTDFAQDWDLVLRATETAREVGHIPQILYHWRAIRSSVAHSGEAKPLGLTAGKGVLTRTLARRGIEGAAVHPDWAASIAAGYYRIQFPDCGPEVAIVIQPTDDAERLRACIESITKTSYRNYKVFVIDDGGERADVWEYLASARFSLLCSRILADGLNLAERYNQAANQLSADYILFLSDAARVVLPDWLSQMAGYMGIAGVGAVGARLVDRGGRFLHAGISHRDGIGPRSPFDGQSASDMGFMGWPLVARNCSAVSPDCLLTARSLFLGLGGLDADSFPDHMGGVDYCYRLIQAGRRVVYCGTAELICDHVVSVAGPESGSEREAFTQKNADFHERFYSPHLTPQGPIGVWSRTVAPSCLRPLRALLSVENLACDDAGLSELGLALRLQARGVIDPFVFSLSDGPLRVEYEKHGIRVAVRDCSADSAITVDRDEFAVAQIAGCLRELNIEVVYAGAANACFAIEAATALGLPSIWMPNGLEVLFENNNRASQRPLYRMLKCLAYPYRVLFRKRTAIDLLASFCSRSNFAWVGEQRDSERHSRAITSGDQDRVISYYGDLFREAWLSGHPRGVAGDGTEDPQAMSESRIQVFWTVGGCYSEAASVSNRVQANGDHRRYVLRLPADASGAIRIDPGSRPAYWQIDYLSVYRGGKGDPRPDSARFVCSSENDFEGLSVLRGAFRVEGSRSYDFICVDGDPQLLLTLPPVFEQASDGPVVVEIVLSAFNVTSAGRNGLTSRLIGALKGLEEERLQSEAALTEALAVERHRIKVLANERDGLLESVRELDSELRRMKGTRAWSVMTWIGKLKHNYLKPFAGWLRLLAARDRNS